MRHEAVSSAARTHPGRVRRHNEDSILARDDLGLWAVADGMGGHAGGRWASATAIEALAREIDEAAADGSALDAAIDAGHAEIAAVAGTTGQPIGTTVAALSFDGRQLCGRWLGDSRIYRCRDGRLEQLSRDHSVVQELVDRGTVTEEEADRHPTSHMLSRAMGMGASADPGRFAAVARAGDRFLLCSDGLSRVIPRPIIAERLASLAPDAAADALLEDALALGAPDNVSMVVLAVAYGAQPAA